MPATGGPSTPECMPPLVWRPDDGPVSAVRGVVPRGGGCRPGGPERDGAVDGRTGRTPELAGGVAQGLRRRGIRLLRQPRVAEVPRAPRESVGGAQLPLEAAGAAGAHRGTRGAGHGSGGGCVLRHPPARKPDWRLGLTTERAAAQPGCTRGGGQGGRGALRRARGPAAPALVRVPPGPRPDRVLEGRAVPASRSRGVPPNVEKRAMDGGAPLPVTAHQGMSRPWKSKVSPLCSAVSVSMIRSIPRTDCSGGTGAAVPPIRVWTQPGWSATVRKPSARRSSASSLVTMLRAALLDRYAYRPPVASAMLPSLLVRLTIFFPLPSRSRGSSARTTRSVPTALTFSTRRMSGGSMSSPPFAPETPALLTSTSTGPVGSWAAKASTLASTATSRRWIRSRTPGRARACSSAASPGSRAVAST